MKWLATLGVSVRSLLNAPLKTALSVSGMAVGIAAVTVLLGLGAGAERAFQEALEKMGKNLLTINAGETEPHPLRGQSRMFQTLSLEDIPIIEDIPNVQRVAPIGLGGGSLRFEGQDLETTVLGSSPQFLEIRGLSLAAGRFLQPGDLEDAARVVVVGHYVVEELFRGEWPLGRTMLVNGAPFSIIGVLEARGFSPEGSDEDNRILIPITTFQRRLANIDYINAVFVQAASQAAMAGVVQQLRTVLRARHQTGPWALDDFEIRDQTRLLTAKREAASGFSSLILGLASLALVLGGIGILAVSMMSVRERWGEIGLRRAVGALPGDILLQFLSESILIAALGGFLGLALGSMGILIGGALSDQAFALTWASLVYPFVISLFIAVIFGVWPAMAAAGLNPITALRSK